MRTLEQLRQDFVNLRIEPTKWLGDSPTRFDTYTRYARQVDSVTEFGVYTGLSTAAFLTGQPKRLRSYDITAEYLTVLPELNHNANLLGVDFEFAIGNSLEIEIAPVDLLFIDTVHKLQHTRRELELHAAKVNKYIIFHDTTAWPGVFKAALEFLASNTEWRVHEHCKQDSGMLVIARHA